DHKARYDHGGRCLFQPKFGNHKVGNGLGPSRGFQYSPKDGSQSNHCGHKPQSSPHSLLNGLHDLVGVEPGDQPDCQTAYEQCNEGMDTEFENQQKKYGNADEDGKDQLGFDHWSCFRISSTISSGLLSMETVKALEGGCRTSNWDCKRSRGIKCPFLRSILDLMSSNEPFKWINRIRSPIPARSRLL